MSHGLHKLKFLITQTRKTLSVLSYFSEATHWLPVNNEITCKRFFKHSILKSQTIIHPVDDDIVVLAADLILVRLVSA